MSAYIYSKESIARRYDYLVMQQSYLLDELDHELDIYMIDSNLSDISRLVNLLLFVGEQITKLK